MTVRAAGRSGRGRRPAAPAVSVRRPLTESRTPSTDPISPTTSSGEVTPTSSTTWTIGASTSRASTCARRVFPSPPGPTIEHDPGTGHQRRGAARDRNRGRAAGRLVTHTAATGWSSASRSRWATAAARRGWCPGDRVSRAGSARRAPERRRSTDRGLAVQEVGEQRLVLWPLRARPLERGKRFSVRARCGCEPARGSRGRGQVLGRRASEGPATGPPPSAVSREPPASASALRGELGRRRGVALKRGPGVTDERREPHAVDLARRDSQSVADAVAHDRVRSAGAPRARDEHLQAFVALAGASSPQTSSTRSSLAPAARRWPPAPRAAPAHDRRRRLSPPAHISTDSALRSAVSLRAHIGGTVKKGPSVRSLTASPIGARDELHLSCALRAAGGPSASVESVGRR